MTTTGLCLGPIPDHLRPREWYAPHQAWMRDRDLPHHDPGDAEPCRAILDGATLDGANLANARLDGVWLRGASLDDACLDDAWLRGARLDGARLVGASLVRAWLDDAWLDDANLIFARLTGACLDGVSLDDAYLDGVAEDVRDLCYAVPVEERRGLLAALEEGRVDGSTYSGECACLVGTIAQRRGVDPHEMGADASRPAERWALAIRPGDTPESSEICRLTAQWVRETIP